MLKKIWETFAPETYDPNKGWRAIYQPEERMEAADYHMIATEAAPTFNEQLKNFCQSNKLSVIEVTPQALLEYESSDLRFRPWLTKYCEQTGQNPHADAMVVVGVKPLESCLRKETYDPVAADRIKDYLRGMIVRLDNKSSTQGARLTRFGDLLSSLENDERSIARKNQFWEPTKNGYRGYKALWIVETPETSELYGFSILGEVKLEPESHMDAHKLTRKYMGFQRTVAKKAPAFFDSCLSTWENLTRTASTNSQRMANTAKALDTLARYIYDRLYEREGYNRFLDPQKLAQHTPPEKGVLHSQVNAVVEMIGDKILKDIIKSGVVPAKWARNDQEMTHDKV